LQHRLADSVDARMTGRHSLKGLTDIRAGKQEVLDVPLTVKMSQQWAVIGSMDARAVRYAAQTDRTDVRKATFHDVKGKYDTNVLAGYTVWAVNADTLSVTDLGFVPYVKGQNPSISGIVLAPGTYDIHFKLQGFRWSDWATSRKFRIVVTPVGPEPSVPPVLTWADPAYSFYPGSDAIYWVWNNVIGAYAVYRFCFWMSEAGVPDITQTPVYIGADQPRNYGYLWAQTNPVYVAVAAQYYNSDGDLVTGAPIYQTVPQNIYAPPVPPEGQFAYDVGIEPVDTTIYPSGIVVYAQSPEGVDGGPVYNDNKSGTVYVV
jgi:hypothetical protein